MFTKCSAPRETDRHKCHLQFLLLHLTSNNGRISCLYKRYATKYWLQQPLMRAAMTVVAMPRRHRKIEADAEYRQRMLVNAVAAGFVTFLMVTAYWVVTTLVQVS